MNLFPKKKVKIMTLTIFALLLVILLGFIGYRLYFYYKYLPLCEQISSGSSIIPIKNLNLEECKKGLLKGHLKLLKIEELPGQ